MSDERKVMSEEWRTAGYEGWAMGREPTRHSVADTSTEKPCTILRSPVPPGFSGFCSNRHTASMASPPLGIMHTSPNHETDHRRPAARQRRLTAAMVDREHSDCERPPDGTMRLCGAVTPPDQGSA